jgi:hypothetical protein
MKKLIIGSIFGIGLLTATSCKKNFLDINVDPNNPTTATVDLVLPPALGFSAYELGNPYQILGGFWSQYWTQGPTGSQFEGYDQYAITSSDFDRQWDQVFTGPLNDFRYIIEQSAGQPNKNYAAIGKIMQAYMFQYMTDLHGDIPFSETLKGSTILNPKFDSQQEIYDGLITLVNEGLAMLDENSDVHPGDDDLVFHGDMFLWRKFANTLKLKIYLRQAYVRASVAQAGIQAMYAANEEFLDFEEEASVHFTETTFNQNPLFTFINSLGEHNILASRTALNYLQNNNDPRIDVFYQRATAAPSTGQHVGIRQGEGRLLPNPATLSDRQYSKPGPDVGGAPDGEEAPVIFMSEAESYFLQAEAVVRGWATGNAEQLYYDGITLSFLRWGFSEDDAADYAAQASILFPTAGTAEQKIRAIMIQKWISMCGTQGVEAWTEWRRTGYPDFFTISLTSNIGARFPVRILIGDSEVTSNPNTPPQKLVTDKMWWDVNTTGQN